MKFDKKVIIFLLFAVFSLIISIWGPEALARYQDRGTLNKIQAQTVETAGEGYSYKLNANEKLYILSRCLSSQTLPETEQNAMTHTDDSVMYQDLEGSYAFIANYRSPSEQEITNEQI